MSKVKNWFEINDAQRIERWENVLRVLQALTPHERRKHWNMANWGIKTECGTVACAAGHCGLDPWFRRRGFKLLPEKVGKETLIPTGFGGFENDVSVDDFFGDQGSSDIFYNTQVRPVSQVIKEVKKHIQKLKDPYFYWYHTE
jgi:hypothetical protein